jgi:hypothetical protein
LPQLFLLIILWLLVVVEVETLLLKVKVEVVAQVALDQQSLQQVVAVQ